jgi:predicted metal-dependent HD superfamily phosphohydrolase
MFFNRMKGTRGKKAARQTGRKNPRPFTKRLSLPKKGKVVTPEELTQILLARARPLYEGPQSRGGYHHWGHIEESLKEAGPIIDRVVKSGVRLDRSALTHAIIGHDMLFHENPSLLGLPSKEHASADYMYRFLRQLGAPEGHARKVVRIILCTHFLAEPRSPEEIIMRATDLSNLAGPYAKFVSNTQKLHREAEILTGKKEPFNLFARRSLNFLPLYIFRFLHLTPSAFSARGSSQWHEKALANSINLFSTINGGRKNVRVVAQIGIGKELTPRTTTENDFVIGVEGNDRVREMSLFQWRTAAQQEKTTNPAFFVPGNPSTTPIPTRSCDIVYVQRKWYNESARQEIRRILRPNGKVIVFK